jgi:hypothetical protein
MRPKSCKLGYYFNSKKDGCAQYTGKKSHICRILTVIEPTHDCLCIMFFLCKYSILGGCYVKVRTPRGVI